MRIGGFLLAVVIGWMAIIPTANGLQMASHDCWWETYDLPINVGGGYFQLVFCLVGGDPTYVGCIDSPLFGPPACP